MGDYTQNAIFFIPPQFFTNHREERNSGFQFLVYLLRNTPVSKGLRPGLPALNPSETECSLTEASWDNNDSHRQLKMAIPYVRSIKHFKNWWGEARELAR